MREEIKIDNKITSLKLTELLIDLGIKMLDDIISSVLENKIKTLKQKNIPYDMHTSKDLPNNGFLDFSKSMDEISLFLRSMDFGKVRIIPYPKVSLIGEVYDVLSYSIENNFIELNLNNKKTLKMEIK